MLYVGVYSSSWTYSINVSWNKLLQRETSALCRVQRAELPPLNSIMLSHLASTTGPVCCGRGSVWTQRANRVKAQHLDKCHKLVGKFNHAFFFLFFFRRFVSFCFCRDHFCSGQYKLYYICLCSQKKTTRLNLRLRSNVIILDLKSSLVRCLLGCVIIH